MDILSVMILTVPILFPAVVAMGFDPIWFGVIYVLCCEMAVMTPPIGMLCFVLADVTGVPLNTFFRGVIPFVGMIAVCIALLMGFPQIATFLPSTM